MVIETVIRYKDCYGREHLTLEEAKDAQNRGVIREYLKTTDDGRYEDVTDGFGRRSNSGYSMADVARIIYENRKNLMALLGAMNG